MKTYETDGPRGIYVMYLCNGIPKADVKHCGPTTYITVPDEDEKELIAYLKDQGYTYTLV